MVFTEAILVPLYLTITVEFFAKDFVKDAWPDASSFTWPTSFAFPVAVAVVQMSTIFFAYFGPAAIEITDVPAALPPRRMVIDGARIGISTVRVDAK